MVLKLAPLDRGGEGVRKSLDLDVAFVEFVSRGVGVEVGVEHRLRRVPEGAIPSNWVGVVYWDANGGSAPVRVRPWTDVYCYFLPQTAAGVKHRFMVF